MKLKYLAQIDLDGSRITMKKSNLVLAHVIHPS